MDETAGRDNMDVPFDVTFVWQRNKHAGLQPLLQEPILSLLITTIFAEHTANANPPAAPEIPFSTEYEHNGFVYQAHPNYRGEGGIL